MVNTKESAVKRDLRTPKYRMRTEVDRKKEEKIQGVEEINLDDELAMCEHNYMSGCPFCK